MQSDAGHLFLCPHYVRKNRSRLQARQRAADGVTAKNKPRLQPFLYEPYAGNPAPLAQGLRVRRHSLTANPFSVLTTVIVGGCLVVPSIQLAGLRQRQHRAARGSLDSQDPRSR